MKKEGSTEKWEKVTNLIRILANIDNNKQKYACFFESYSCRM